MHVSEGNVTNIETKCVATSFKWVFKTDFYSNFYFSFISFKTQVIVSYFETKSNPFSIFEKKTLTKKYVFK